MAENKNNNKEKLPIVFTTVHGNGDFKFKKPIENVKYIKFKILEWHKHISMRCDVYIDDELKDFPESSRTYSSIYGQNEGRIQAHSRSSLSSPQAWSAKTNDTNQWIIMDLIMPSKVTGVAVRTRADYDQHVNKLTVQYSIDGNEWIDVKEPEEEDETNGGISPKREHFNPLAIKSVIVQRKINGLTYTIEASTLLSGKTVQLVAEDELFKVFKETWRVSTIIDQLKLDKDVDVESEAFLLEAAQKIKFIPHRSDRRKRRMSFTEPKIIERPTSASKQRERARSRDFDNINSKSKNSSG